MKLWNSNRNSAPGGYSRPRVGGHGAASEDKSATRPAPPQSAAELIREAGEKIRPFRSPQRRASVTAPEAANASESPPVCAGRQRDCYFWQIPEPPPSRRGTGPPGNAA